MSYRDKLRLMIVLLLALSVGVSGAWLMNASFDGALEREVTAARTEQRMALYMLAAAGQSGDETALTATVRTLERQTGQAFRLTDAEGRTIYQSTHGAGFQDGLLKQAAADTLSWRIQQDDRNGHSIQIAGVLADADRTFYLEALRPVEEVYRARNDLSRSFCWLMLAVAIAGTLAATLLSRWLTASLTALAGTARAIADGDISRRAAVMGTDEIGGLAADFNIMTDRLAENIAALEDAMMRQEEFMASFAHEMRTPMTSIIGYADLLRSQELPREIRSEAANYIFSEGKRLESLSNKLLDLIVLKKQTFAKKTCKMSQLIAQVGGLFDQTFRQAGIALHGNCDASVWMVEPDLFKTLLINLLDNARKAMPEGGEIVLEAGMEGEDWCMTIRDSGRGMPPEAIPRLTEAFYRVDKARARASGGVGLGLRLSAEIVHLHDGTLSFDSKEGCGTTVTVRLKGAAK